MKNEEIAKAKQLMERVKGAFAANPDINEVHITSDGQCFTKQNSAIMHGNSLNPSGTQKVTREMSDNADTSIFDNQEDKKEKAPEALEAAKVPAAEKPAEPVAPAAPAKVEAPAAPVAPAAKAKAKSNNKK